MAGPYVTADQVKAAVGRRLHKDPASLKPLWDGVCADAITDGYSDIRNRLASRGYTEAQIDAWDDRVRFSLDQSLFWAMVKGASAGEKIDEGSEQFDHRKELEGPAFLTLTVNGKVVRPGAAAGEGAPVAGGSMSVTSDGVDYATTFGLRVNRNAGANEFGDDAAGRW